MKKIVIVIVSMFIFHGSVIAARNVEYSEVDKIQLTLILGASKEVNGLTMYAPFAYFADAEASSSDGFIIRESCITTLGQLRLQPYTKKETYNLLPAVLKPAVKDVYLRTISIDISQ